MKQDQPFSFAFLTLGCKVNQYETHALREQWAAQGHRETHSLDTADLVCVNSCAVTAKAVADVRAALRKARRANPQAKILLTGCAAKVLAEKIGDMADMVVPQEDKALLGTFPLAGPSSVDVRTDPAAFPPFAVSGYDRSRALVKVQDGCSHRCTYCIVPLTRGASRSRPVAECLEEIGRLLAAGFREISLSGINLRQFGRDLPGKPDFWDLLLQADQRFSPQWQGQARFRLSSLEPGQLGEKALVVLGACRMVAPHLHLSLQSGSPTVLRRMGRGHYQPGSLLPFLTDLSRIWPVFGLGADILTAFPGEMETEFAETLDLCRELPLSYAHVFPFSPRPGTVAAKLPDQVGAEKKRERSAILRSLVEDKRAAFLERCLGLDRVVVAAEGAQPSRGVSEHYLDCRLETLPPNPQRRLIPARPLRISDKRLVVRPLCSL